MTEISRHLPPLVNAHGLSKKFGIAPLFQNISFSVAEGDRIGLIGPNGSGKSTLLDILAGNTAPDSGEVALRKRVRLAKVAQVSDFAAGETVRSVIEKAMREAHVPEPERASRFAETLGRANFSDVDAATSSLSGGWKKRLAVAAALGHGDVWISADADDRPQHLYARLGFRPVWRMVQFTRLPWRA